MSVNEVSGEQETVQRWNPEIAPWRAAADQGRLLLKNCEECGRAHYYPRTICPFCFSDRTVWRESGGLGRIYTFSVEGRALQPFVIAYVELDEGPIMMTRIVDVPDFARIDIGDRVELDAEGSRNHGAPVFRVAQDPTQ